MLGQSLGFGVDKAACGNVEGKKTISQTVVNWEIEKIKVIWRIAWLEGFVRLRLMTDKKAEKCIRTILVAKNLIAYNVFQDIGKTLFFGNVVQKYLIYLLGHCLSVYLHSDAPIPDHFSSQCTHTSLTISYF